MPQPPQDLRQFQSLVEIMTILRSPEGCPWDQEQTHRSLSRYAIEEVYELVEAIEDYSAATNDRPHDASLQGSNSRPSPDELVEELGDVLLQVVFHAELGRSSGAFSIADVVEAVNTKMVFRHPHVFGDVEAQSSAQVLANWAKLKEVEAERKKKRKKKSIFGIPPALPALEQANKIGEKTSRVGFDWHDVPGVLAKMREEIDELEEAYAEGTIAEHEHELGDVLFTVAQVARHLNVNAEEALRRTNRRFESRYERMIELINADGQTLATLTDDQKESYWQQAKRQLKSQETV